MTEAGRTDAEQASDEKVSGVITRRVKAQLLVFAVITLVGCAYVGARFAQLDQLVFSETYTVVAHLPDSGGIFAGGEVTYRGTSIGRIDKMELTREGVDAYLVIDDKWDKIPADTLTVVQNRSALGEQYIELQPQSNGGPYLEDDSEIAPQQARLPIPPMQLLADVSTTVDSVKLKDLQTTVAELGKAFEGTGDDLSTIIDTSNSFIETANENFDITAALIRDSKTVLDTQLDKASAIREFSRNLAAFTTTVAGSDKDIRRLIDNGSVAANDLRGFIEDNDTELAALLNNLVTLGDIQVRHLDGIQQILVMYPYVVENGFSVVAKDRKTGHFDAHFGAVFTEKPLCHHGYESTDTRPPSDGSNRPMNVNAHCAEPATVTNARGAQWAPRPAPAYALASGRSWQSALLLPLMH